MDDPWGTGGFKGGGEGLERANRKKNRRKNLKNWQNKKKSEFFLYFFSFGTALELTLNPLRHDFLFMDRF